MPDNQTVINQTRKWLCAVIIGHGLCPFAKREYDSGRIDYAVITDTDPQPILEQIMTHCAALETNAAIETTLIILPIALAQFEDYLDVLDMANELLAQRGYEGIYQLASFHPDYRFDGCAADDPSNYTNRSPYPIIHILREASVEAALKHYPNPKDIPQRNIELTRELGLKVMQDLLGQCYK